MIMNRFLLALTMVLLFSACQTTVTISENMSPAEIIQRAHEAMDRNRYNIALQYYHALYDRNRTNADLVITAEYHIAHIHYKEGRFDQARQGMNGVLEYYNSPDAILLPQHFKVLAQIVLNNIDEKENQTRRFWRR
jgi:outer membrane protein assembly factor BamD (BamD/ComL family)